MGLPTQEYWPVVSLLPLFPHGIEKSSPKDLREIFPQADDVGLDLLKETGSGMIDRISNLPDDILFLILSNLTLRDAARVKILSRRWRRLSIFVPNLCLDRFTMFGLQESNCRFDVGDDSGRLKYKFLAGVDEILRLWDGQKIISFRVCFELGKESARHINRWINCAVKMGTEKVDLAFCGGSPLYWFPRYLLLPGLKHLCLRGCLLKMSRLDGRFNSLISLNLWKVPLDESDFRNINLNCGNLESLVLKQCSLPRLVSVTRNLHHLRSLIVDSCYDFKFIHLCSLSLNEFEHIGPGSKIVFADVPQLEKMHLGSKYRYNGLANDVPRLQYMSLVLPSLKVQPIPSDMSRFCCLRQLELFVPKFSAVDLLDVTYFLDASPLLQKFHLAVTCGPIGELKKKHIHKFHSQLKEVELSNFHGGSCNLAELAIYFLNYAIALERMIINSEARIYRGGGNWFTEACPYRVYVKLNRVRDQILRVKTAMNSNVDIIFLSFPPHD